MTLYSTEVCEMKRKNMKKLHPPLILPPEGSAGGMIPTDPQGSYTGIPEEKWGQPVQDADDL